MRAAIGWTAGCAVALAATHAAGAAGAMAPAPAPMPAQVPVSGAWPQAVGTAGRSYTVFAPEFRSFTGSSAVFTQPVSVVPPPGTAAVAVMGSISVLAQVSPGADDGELELHSFQVQSFTVGGSDAPAEDLAAIQQAIGGRAIAITRRALLHDMQLENAREASTPGLDDSYPAIRVVRRRVALLAVDGDPALVPVGTGGWLRAVNTPFILLQSPDGAFVARLGESRWVRAARLDADFAPADAPPADVVAALGTAPRAGSPGAPPAPAAAGAPSAGPPALVVATRPTALVSINGEPQLADVAPGVQWAANARPTLLRTAPPAAPEAWWTLVGGRWFRAASLEGAWQRVAPADLPRAFTALPGGRRFDAAKASVPGTPESVLAVAAAQAARSVRIDRAAARCGVAWQGDPAWIPVPGTDMRGSLNASQPVIECDGAWYCCDAAVWFRAADPRGPWAPCDDLPDAFVTIPAASPFFPLTGVTVAAADAASITFAYTPLYLGTCIDDGTVVYGTANELPDAVLPGGIPPALPQPCPMALSFDLDTGTFAPDVADEFDGMQPAPMPEALVGGWTGWGWCPGWTSAWAWAWSQPASWEEWRPWWRRWDPYWNRWANARTAEQRRRDDAAARELAERQAEQAASDRAADEQAAADERREISAEEAAWRDRQAADRAARDAQRDEDAAARADAARFADLRDDARREQDRSARPPLPRTPTAPRGTMAWWFQFYNDYSHGYLSRSGFYRDPRYAPGTWGTPGPR